MFKEWRIRMFAQRKTSKRIRSRRRILQAEPLERRQMCATDIFVASNGNDVNGTGTIEAPYESLAKALVRARAGDSVVLREGLYAGGVRVDRPNVTIRAHADERAIIRAPISNEDIESVIRFSPQASGGKLLNVEIVGGYYYGVKIDSVWSDVPAERIGASRITIENSRIHDTGRDCIKITPGCDDIVIRHNEIFRSGRRDPSNAEGIDNVNGDRMVVQENYIHDIATNGLYAKGGSIGTIIERNLVRNTGGAGIMLGFQDTDEEWFDLTVNPDYYESINGVIRNNLVINASLSGVALFGTANSTVTNNTLVNVAQSSHAAIRLVSSETFLQDRTLRVPNEDVKVANNIVRLSSESDSPAFAIEEDGLAGGLRTAANRYFHVGQAATFSDDRSSFEGNLVAWKLHVQGESGSSEGNPRLDANMHLVADSACIDAGSGQFISQFDYDGSVRSGASDIGADEFGGPTLVVPPATGSIGIGTAPLVRFGATSLKAESVASHRIAVRLAAASTQPITVGYRIVGGTATAGVDYRLEAGTITFAPGETVAFIPLRVLNDALDESNETVSLRLVNPTNALLGVATPLNYVIQDDDPTPTVGFAEPSDSISEAGTRSLAVVRLSAPSGRRVTIAYRGSGNATASADYHLPSGNLIFEPGQTQKTLRIAVVDDSLDEIEETLRLSLQSAIGAAIGDDDTHRLSIVDNDAPPVIRFAHNASSVDEAAGEGRVRVTLSTVSGKTVRVNYAVTAGTAGTNDFTAGTGTLVFAPGQTSKVISIPISNDQREETSETFRVTLSSPLNATLPANPTHVVTIVDDDAVSDRSAIVFSLESTRHVYRIEPEQGATAVDLTETLDQLSAGDDDGNLSISPDGRWMALITDRFGIGADWTGLAVVKADLSDGEAVVINDDFVHPEGAVAIASGGNKVVYSADGGPHELDLWVATKVAEGWTRQLLTADSPFKYHTSPAISADGTKVLFDGRFSDASHETDAICEVRLDGTDFRQVVTQAQRPAGTDPALGIHSGDYAPDGSIVFEADWTGEQIWILRPGAARATLLFPEATNNNSPCVLPDGRVVSLWLNRPGNSEGVHELTVWNSDGTFITLLPEMDVRDVGIGCGG